VRPICVSPHLAVRLSPTNLFLLCLFQRISEFLWSIECQPMHGSAFPCRSAPQGIQLLPFLQTIGTAKCPYTMHNLIESFLENRGGECIYLLPIPIFVLPTPMGHFITRHADDLFKRACDLGDLPSVFQTRTSGALWWAIPCRATAK
jgi:hypothetical protein